ncbi:hypothetical protein DH2020_040384 [Rehmannia glutinosa]|uniref:Glycine-rich protein n=1 Tax=Rehmannia glutinosa TaxID=99300 RepID=A0ABR0UUA7_REHGL
MKSKAASLIFMAFVLVCSVLAEEETSRNDTNEVAHHEIKGDEPKHTNTYGTGFGGYGGGTSGGAGAATGGGATGGATGGGATGGANGNGGSGYSAGFSHGGVYGGGKICKFGCCSESYGYSHGGGGYYGCTCCHTLAEAKAYKETQAKAQTKN